MDLIPRCVFSWWKLRVSNCAVVIQPVPAQSQEPSAVITLENIMDWLQTKVSSKAPASVPTNTSGDDPTPFRSVFFFYHKHFRWWPNLQWHNDQQVCFCFVCVTFCGTGSVGLPDGIISSTSVRILPPGLVGSDRCCRCSTEQQVRCWNMLL